MSIHMSMHTSMHTSIHVFMALLRLELSLALLIGFTWEKCFNSAIETIDEKIAEGSTGPHVRVWVHFCLSFCMVLLVLPAWKLYILPTIHRHAPFVRACFNTCVRACVRACVRVTGRGHSRSHSCTLMHAHVLSTHVYAQVRARDDSGQQATR